MKDQIVLKQLAVVWSYNTVYNYATFEFTLHHEKYNAIRSCVWTSYGMWL